MDHLLDGLDAYGHLAYAVGFSPDSEDAPDGRDGDWLACFDFAVDIDPDGNVVVAYHTVVDSDSGGFTDTPEAEVRTVKDDGEGAPFDLPLYWAVDISIVGHRETWSQSEMDEAERVNEKWNQGLRAAIARVVEANPR